MFAFKKINCSISKSAVRLYGMLFVFPSSFCCLFITACYVKHLFLSALAGGFDNLVLQLAHEFIFVTEIHFYIYFYV